MQGKPPDPGPNTRVTESLSQIIRNHPTPSGI